MHVRPYSMTMNDWTGMVILQSISAIDPSTSGNLRVRQRFQLQNVQIVYKLVQILTTMTRYKDQASPTSSQLAEQFSYPRP